MTDRGTYKKRFLWKEVCTDSILDKVLSVSGNVRKTASLMSLKGSDISFDLIGKVFIKLYVVFSEYRLK
jgi:hypothetical protein